MGSFIWKVAVPSWCPQLVSPFGGRPSLPGKSLAPVGGPQLAKVAVPSCLQLAAAQACPESGCPQLAWKVAVPSWLASWRAVGLESGCPQFAAQACPESGCPQLAWKVAVLSWRAVGLESGCPQLAWKVAVPSLRSCLGKWLSPVGVPVGLESGCPQLAWKVAVPSWLGKWLSPVCASLRRPPRRAQPRTTHGADPRPAWRRCDAATG